MHELVIFGVRDLPRPRGGGFFYYRFASQKSARTIATLDLFDSGDAEQVKLLFVKAIRRFIMFEHIGDPHARKLLRDYRLENMKPNAEELFASAVESVMKQLIHD